MYFLYLLVESTSSSEVENTPKTDENKKTEKPIAENSEIDCGSSNSNHDDDERRKVNFSPFLLKEETEKVKHIFYFNVFLIIISNIKYQIKIRFL